MNSEGMEVMIDEKSEEVPDFSEEELDEMAKSMDEMDDYSISIKKNFFVLRERKEGREERIRIKDIYSHITPETILKKDTLFIEVEGEYYPDFIEEKGLYFVSVGLLDYLKYKIHLGQIESCHVGFVSEEGKRVEEYRLITPLEVDCMLYGSARYSKIGELLSFEIDEEKTGELEIFKVKGFPHLVVTGKLNRIEFSGYECTRIENYFYYEGARDGDYVERISGRKLEESVKEFEKLAEALEKKDCVLHIKRICSSEKVKWEVREGLSRILTSYKGEKIEIEKLSDRFFMFFWSWVDVKIELAENHKPFFGVNGFEIKSLREAREYAAKLLGGLRKMAKKVCFEAVLFALADEGKVFDGQEQIHGDKRFRLYIHEEDCRSMNATLIHDFKNSFQRKVEEAKEFSGFDFKGKDLREFDFSGKNLKGIRFEECNLRRARFHKSVLTGAEFKSCDLTGTEFKGSSLREARLIENEMDRTNFDNTDMKGVEITGSDLFHCSFVKSNLAGGKIINKNLSKVFYHKARLLDVVFEVSEILEDNIFSLCDLRGVKFIGDMCNTRNIIYGCDFRNADMSGCCFELNKIVSTKVIKSKLNNAIFSKCDKISKCNFSWSTFLGADIQGVEVFACDFSYVDLSKIRVKSGNLFYKNNFSYAGLSGYDFTVRGYILPNKLVYTDLSKCNLRETDLATSEIMFPNFEGALLNDASLFVGQLKYVELSPAQRRSISLYGDE
ncbi:MAG: pentapeptide repeat-containing protein [Clostridia bacterium]|nr:pentapeptide repeat-containing protein [Clostridia bacterium]